jgi:Alpha-glutamyl/putrescinyl thymine pyrophosphorylase clade 3
MPRFCRHNRFVERCPICRETVLNPAHPAPAEGQGRRSRTRTAKGTKDGRGGTGAGGARRALPHGRRRGGLHVVHEQRAEDDGYRTPLATGLRASADAERLAQEIGFAEGRLLALRTAPPDLYGEIREQEDTEQAMWMCFLSAYLSPLEGPDPFAGIRKALQADWRAGEVPALEEIPLGPRTSHDPARGDATLRAYLQWAEHAGSQAQGFTGDPGWTPARRFERIFERLTLPGLGRMGRYELLVTAGRIGLCEVRAETLCFTNAPGAAHDDLATLAAKRVFGIGDQMHLEHRAHELAKAMTVPMEAFDLALANWGAGERATLGVAPEVLDQHSLERAREALGL